MARRTAGHDRPSRRGLVVGSLLLLATAALLIPLPRIGRAWAQIAVRPDDPLGLSTREPRRRVVHSDRPDVPGTSMYLQQVDPWQAYRRGASVFFHEWSKEDGVLEGVPPFAVALEGSTTSCGMCHNLPFRTAGGGAFAMRPVGFGRKSPHLFGTGLLEILAAQIRAQILDANDRNHNGFLDVPRETRGRRAMVEAAPGVMLDFGALADLEGEGFPSLNRALVVNMVDARGRLVRLGPGGRLPRLGDRGVAGYDLFEGVYGATVSEHQYPTLRVFGLTVLFGLMGIPPDDPTSAEPRGLRRPGDGWAGTSNAGATQPYLPILGHVPPQLGPRSRISEGEADLLEWYMLNYPAPALGRQDDTTRRGRQLMADMGCTSCHVPDWVIQPRDDRRGLPGDRRFFNLAVAYNPATGRLEGHLQDLTERIERPDGTVLRIPRRGGFVVRDLYSDLRHHDVGERFHEYDDEGGEPEARIHWRTAPLWGVGSTAPYGHDGRSPTLDDVIRRHGGEAAAAERAYAAAPAADRQAVVAFLRSLVLYQPDLLPTDLDGDGRIDERYVVAGHEAGPERFEPELLFRVPPHYRGWTQGPDGDRYFSYELLNLAAMYGLDLPTPTERSEKAAPAATGHAAPAPGRVSGKGGAQR